MNIVQVLLQILKNVSEYTKVISTPKKDKSGVARHFTNKYWDPKNPHALQSIEQVSVKEESELDDTFWHKEKYWQALLFIKCHGMNT